MIFKMPVSNVMILLCLALLGLLPMIGGNPLTLFKLTEHDVGDRRIRCSDILAESIHVVCEGKTRSFADVYPASVGHRVKRVAYNGDVYNNGDGVYYKPLQNGPIHECCRRPCGYTELRQYCAPS